MTPNRPPGTASVHRLDDYRTALDRPREQPEDEVWAEILAAGDLYGALAAAGMAVRFDASDPALPPRVRVTDLAGNTLRELSPSVACDPGALQSALLGG
jgi:hypothetical protein